MVTAGPVAVPPHPDPVEGVVFIPQNSILSDVKSESVCVMDLTITKDTYINTMVSR